MKTTAKIITVLCLFFALACSKDEPIPEPQQKVEQKPEPEPEPEVEPENQPPGEFTTSVEVNKNMAQLNWTAPIDPDGDTITYSIMLGDSLVSTQTETGLDLSSLIFEKDYQGKIIADDGNGHQQETIFDFTTGLLWLANYEVDNGSGNGFEYIFNEVDKLVTVVRSQNGTLKNLVYDSNGQIFSIDNMTYTHNANGLLTTISDGTGKGDLELLYDNQDRLRKVNITRTSSSNNYQGIVEMDFIYNGIGNLETIDYHRRYTSDNVEGTVNNFFKYRYVYDNDGNVTELRHETSDDDIEYEVSIREEFTYDEQKNPWYSILTRQIDFGSRIYFGAGGELDPYGVVFYNIEGYGLKIIRSEHNITNHKVYTSGNLILDYTYEYTYNESGYPVSAKTTTGGNEFFPRWTYHE